MKSQLFIIMCYVFMFPKDKKILLMYMKYRNEDDLIEKA